MYEETLLHFRKDRTNPFIAKVGCSVIDQKTGEVKYKYKRIGTFKTRFEAEYALRAVYLSAASRIDRRSQVCMVDRACVLCVRCIRRLFCV